MNYQENSLNLPLFDVLQIMQKRIMNNTQYFGVKTLKNPLDFWVYQEIIYEQKPDVIIEIGNKWGGSSLALAHFLDSIGSGRIIGIDIDHSILNNKAKKHPRTTFIEGDAISAFKSVKKLIKDHEKVLIIEDSSHTYENTLDVLKLYSYFIQSNGYIIIEDSICHHGLDIGPSPGPFEAIEDFIKENDEFSIDRDKESFFITWNPKGFLCKNK